MCGIAGVIAKRGLVRSDLLTAMRDTMLHRGPDAAGFWLNDKKKVGFAHRRLSIIDLSEAGKQPMMSNDGKQIITFNGEIYNYLELKNELQNSYEFITSTDTEVLLAGYCLHGLDFIKRLNGMFAFAIYDKNKDIVVLARDRAGEKPLYIYQNGDVFTFASEIKAILKYGYQENRINKTGLNHYLTYGYCVGKETMFEGIQKLLPGHLGVYDLNINKLTTTSYWNLPPSSESNLKISDYLEQFQYILQDSVNKRLRSDVPIGILLSGGIDSGLISGLAQKIRAKPVKTFTVSFPNHSKFDEGPIARKLSKQFGTEHIELEAIQPPIDILPQLAKQFDDPIADSALIPTYLVTKEIRKHAVVALSGDGGDELFGGYPHYNYIRNIFKYNSPIFYPIKYLIRLLANLTPVGFKGRNYALNLTQGENCFYNLNTFYDKTTQNRLLQNTFASALDTDQFQCKKQYDNAAESVLQRATRLDFLTTLVDGYLVKVDRSSMLNSLEVRAPFLDHRLIEFAFKDLPDKLKISGGQLKILPKLCASKLFYDGYNNNIKRGFTMPLSSWFKGDWGNFMKDILLRDETIFNKNVVQELFKLQENGYNNSGRIFCLAFFEMWRKEYNINNY